MWRARIFGRTRTLRWLETHRAERHLLLRDGSVGPETLANDDRQRRNTGPGGLGLKDVVVTRVQPTIGQRLFNPGRPCTLTGALLQFRQDRDIGPELSEDLAGRYSVEAVQRIPADQHETAITATGIRRGRAGQRDTGGGQGDQDPRHRERRRTHQEQGTAASLVESTNAQSRQEQGHHRQGSPADQREGKSMGHEGQGGSLPC